MKWKLYPATELHGYADRWQALNHSATDSPVLHPDFVLPLLDKFGNGQEILGLYGEESSPEAMVLLSPKGHGVWQSFQPSQAPVALWVAARSVAFDTSLRALIASLPGFPLLTGITQLDPSFYARPADTGRLTTIDYIRTARIPVSGTFDEYWSARGKNLRHNMKRQRNRLQKENVSMRLVTLTRPEDVPAGLAAYSRLETAGWKAAHGTAIGMDNAQGRYYVDMLQRFCARADGRIYQYWYNDQLVATDLCIRHNGVLVILKTTYDETQDTSSPALLMRQDTFHQIFEEGGVHSIEFYGPVMDWHTKWAEDIRTLYHVNFYRWPLLAGLHRARLRRNRPESERPTASGEPAVAREPGS